MRHLSTTKFRGTQERDRVVDRSTEELRMGQQMNPAIVRGTEDDRRSPRLDPEALGDLASELSGSPALDLVVELVHDIRSRKPSSFSIGGLLESVADMVRPIAVEKEIELRVVAPRENDERVGHRPALNRVLLNLATNALEFTDEGYVEIAATSSTGRRLPFSVRDTGPGFAPTEIETYLDPFRRSRTGNGYRLSKTGLGLTTCEKLLQSMGSKLKVETRHGWGTRFHFELDLPSASAFKS